MASRTALSALVLAVVGSAPTSAQVQAVTLFAHGGGYSTLYHAYNLNTGSVDDFKTGFILGGGVGLQLHRYLEIRASLTGAQTHLLVSGAPTTAYLNRYYVGVDAKLQYPLPSGVTPYGLAGGGGVVLYEKGTTGQSKTQGFGHLGAGLSYPIQQGLSVFVQGDGYFYSLSGFSGGALSSAYSSAQFDIAWSAGASFKLPL
ncbi:MAG TPA: outer membrane beta-barrel protein [Gemmatimonadales bacterium]|nr:outer membrane beta-barrel protein [Gemmatimonadales bacterium]